MGDITITANRSRLIDFTQPPYTYGGVSMVIPLKYIESSPRWIWFKLMSLRALLILIGIFICICALIFLVEATRDQSLQGALQRRKITIWTILSAIIIGPGSLLVLLPLYFHRYHSFELLIDPSSKGYNNNVLMSQFYLSKGTLGSKIAYVEFPSFLYLIWSNIQFLLGN